MSRRGWLLFVAMSVLWGIPYYFIKVAVREISAPDIVLARTLVGALLLLPFAIRAKALVPALREWRWVLVFGVAEMAIPWLLIVDAERKLPSALVGMLISFVPLAGTAMTWLFLDRRVLHRARVVGLIVGVAGVALLLGLNALSQPTHWFSILEALAVTVLYAGAPIVADRKLKHVPAVGVITVSLLAVAVGYLPVVLLTLPHAMPRAAALGSVAVLAIVCTAVAFILFFALIGEVGPLRATVITFVNPAVAVVLGVALLSEPITWGTVVGFPTVLVGSWLATRPAPEPGLDLTAEATAHA